MKYNFDETVPRRGSNSLKWDSTDPGILPMWVADMDFRTAPQIISALEKRVQHGVFGYARVPDEYYEVIEQWCDERHEYDAPKEHILFTTGVVPALSATIKALTAPGDRVIVQTPVYNCFFSSIRNNGCETVSNPLIYKDGKYTIDFEDLESKASDPRAKLLLLCNPHNPAGRVWTLKELDKINEICHQYRLIIVSDEIHCDLVYPLNMHHPILGVAEKYLYNRVALISPSKTFNLAGIQVANIISANGEIKDRIDRALNINEVCEISAFAVEAQIAAYRYGGEWLDELTVYLYDNYLYLKDCLAEYLPQLTVLPLEATYLVWVDCSKLGLSSEKIAGILLREGQLRINAGTMYGKEGEGFIRFNIACPRQTLADGLQRFIRVFGKK
ncbi:MAG: pyridoxal phosphate-dependent aminotransferase [Prevotellaceae bacterium]|nr:pyridoxal phosphate-dependent aminotransferase [Prevotellaceae bacterium]